MNVNVMDHIHRKITYLQFLHLRSVLHGRTPFLIEVKDMDKLVSHIHD